MIARIVTYFASQFGLLLAKPNWESSVKITLDLPTDVAKEPITFNESRRAFAQSARYTMQWTSYLANAKDATELRMFFTRIRGEFIAAPLWPDVCEISAPVVRGATTIHLFDSPARFGTLWIIGNDDFSTWELITGTLNGTTFTCAPGTTKAWPAGTLMYPLIVGRITDRPQAESITDECMEVDITVKENSGFGLRISTPAGALPVVGNHIPAFAATPLLAWRPNHVRPLDWTEQPDVVYEQVGFLRYEQQRAYDHRNARAVEFEFYENTRANITRLERFWRDRRATTRRFMVPTWRGDMRMRANTPVTGTPTRIPIEDSFFTSPSREVQPGDPYVALIGRDDVPDPYQLSGTFEPPPAGPLNDLPDQPDSGQSYLIATRNVGAHTATDTVLSHLMLARFMDAKLEWDYTTPYLATTRIKIRELPHEYEDTPADLPEPAYLFGFAELGVTVYRFTSYENTIVIPTGTWAGTWVPAPFSFDTVRTGLKLDQEKLDFKSFKFDGNPLNKMWPFALDGLLTMWLVEVDAARPLSSTAKVRFYGEVWRVDSDYKATAIAYGSFFERKFPRFLLSISDNFIQFSEPTKIPASAFKITGTVNARSGQVIIIDSAAAHAKAADYFAGGWIETAPSGTGPFQPGAQQKIALSVDISFGPNFERRGILHSAPAAGSLVTLHIDRPLLKGANGQPIDLYPGYDGSITECDTKFNNRINFGGHPYIPNVNPAVKAMKAKQVQGGKK